MYEIRENSFHPFGHYMQGRIQSYGGSHYLRKYSNVLWVMTNIGTDSFTATRRVYDKGRVNEYEMSLNEISDFNILLEGQKDLDKLREEKIRKIQSPLQGAKVVDFKSYEAVTVIMHEYAVTKADCSQPILGTFGTRSCVILALYDHENKTAVLAHIDAFTEIDSLQMLFDTLSKENTVAHLAGGDLSSKEMCIDIIELLEKNNIRIVNSDIARSSFGIAASFAIDARTGNIYSPVRHYQLHETPDIEMRLRVAGLKVAHSPIKEYKGSKLIAPVKKDSTSIGESSSFNTSLTASLTESLTEYSSQAKTLTLGFLKPENKKIKNTTIVDLRHDFS